MRAATGDYCDHDKLANYFHDKSTNHLVYKMPPQKIKNAHHNLPEAKVMSSKGFILWNQQFKTQIVFIYYHK